MSTSISVKALLMAGEQCKRLGKRASSGGPNAKDPSIRLSDAQVQHQHHLTFASLKPNSSSDSPQSYSKSWHTMCWSEPASCMKDATEALGKMRNIQTKVFFNIVLTMNACAVLMLASIRGSFRAIIRFEFFPSLPRSLRNLSRGKVGSLFFQAQA